MAAGPYSAVVRPGVWIRAREPWTYAGAGFGVLCGLGVGYALIHAYVTRWTGHAWGDGLEMACFLAILAGIPILLSVRALRAAIRFSADGVTVRGLLRTTRVPLREVEGFAPRGLGLGGVRSTVGIVMRRRARHDLVVWALRHGEFSDRRSQEAARQRWQPLCDELDELVRSLRGEGAAPPCGPAVAQPGRRRATPS